MKTRALAFFLTLSLSFSLGFIEHQKIGPLPLPSASSVRGLTMTPDVESIFQAGIIGTSPYNIFASVYRVNSTGYWELDSAINGSLTNSGGPEVRLGTCLSSNGLLSAVSVYENTPSDPGFVEIYKRDTLLSPWVVFGLLTDPDTVTATDRFFGDDIVCSQSMNEITVSAPGRSNLVATNFYMFKFNETEQAWTLFCTKTGTTGTTLPNGRAAMGISLDETTIGLASGIGTAPSVDLVTMSTCATFQTLVPVNMTFVTSVVFDYTADILILGDSQYPPSNTGLVRVYTKNQISGLYEAPISELQVTNYTGTNQGFGAVTCGSGELISTNGQASPNIHDFIYKGSLPIETSVWNLSVIITSTDGLISRSHKFHNRMSLDGSILIAKSVNDIIVFTEVGTCQSVLPPTAPPVEAPVAPPVGPPAETPVQSPVEAPIESPVEPPASPPVEPPVESPVEQPIEPPVSPPTQPPVSPPISPPVTQPVQAPVNPPVSPPVEAPTQTPVESPQDAPGSIPPSSIPTQTPFAPGEENSTPTIIQNGITAAISYGAVVGAVAIASLIASIVAIVVAKKAYQTLRSRPTPSTPLLTHHL
jgi:hypothetical protein